MTTYYMECPRCGNEMRSNKVDDRYLMFCTCCPNVEDYPANPHIRYIKIEGVMTKCIN